MQRRVAQKWRPPLMLVLGGSLLVVLVLPLLGLVVLEALAPRLGEARAAAAVALGAVSATLVLGWLLWRLILAPVRALAARAEAIRGGAAPEPMTRYGTPEIGELGQAVLDMAEALRARELAVRSYTDHVTHELKTPLTAIRGAAELLASDPDLGEEARGLAGTIAGAERRAERLLVAARDIAAARAPDHHGTARLSEVELPGVPDGVRIELRGGDVVLPLDGEGMRIVLTHLVGNAVAAGARSVTVTAEPLGPVLEIADDGPGISPGNRDRVFEPFFTTRRDAGGTGMGLAIVQTLLLAHGGSIALVDSDCGTRFRISF